MFTETIFPDMTFTTLFWCIYILEETLCKRSNKQNCVDQTVFK